jgi:ABC-type dipeptide/oligopeptide/nickel transport system ATPase component
MIINEIESDLPRVRPVREVMGVYIPNIHNNLPHRNGFVYAMIGAGGSGKSSLMISMFKSPKYYRNKFDNIHYFTPQASFLSVEKHPFQDHDKVYHELDEDTLQEIYDELLELKENCLDADLPVEHSLIIIDDFASDLKDKNLIKKLNNMIVKTRHTNCSWIFTLQAYNLFPMVLRKQITNATIFKPNNNEEWESVSKELLNLSKKNSITLYDYIYDANYNHLDVDTKENKIYKNFNLLELQK